MNADQLRRDIVRPALRSIGLHSQAAENLVMGTAAVESELEYVRQHGDGPALSFFQMEPATHDDIWQNYLFFRKELTGDVLAAIEASALPDADRLLWDMRYAAIMCRLQYRRHPESLPDARDVWAMAAYWKSAYNTHLGAGTVEKFVEKYALVQ